MQKPHNFGGCGRHSPIINQQPQSAAITGMHSIKDWPEPNRPGPNQQSASGGLPVLAIQPLAVFDRFDNVHPETLLSLRLPGCNPIVSESSNPTRELLVAFFFGYFVATLLVDECATLPWMLAASESPSDAFRGRVLESLTMPLCTKSKITRPALTCLSFRAYKLAGR